MPKKKLFEEDSDEDIDLKTENEYAKKYDTWREKEELHKLEQKYGDKPSSDVSSDSEDDSDEPVEVSEETETQFLKTLALLKTKDPRIYDPEFKCFDDTAVKTEEEKPKTKTLTFEDSSDDDDDDDGDIFTIEKKAVIEEAPTSKSHQKGSKENKPKLAEYLTGNTDEIEQEVAKDLAPLKALWSDPKISEGEAFLRDYILNKRYLDDGAVGEAEDRLRDDEDLEEDEKRVEEQGRFERAYNFRFEEPDQEYLKRFPRTLNSVRPKDDRRSKKRAEISARKQEEKQRKMDEIARLKALKLKEIQEKIAKIKEVTGNEELAFKDEDLEGDFDPAAHDRRMAAIFDEQYYGDADDQKPVFPDLDEELEIENWDKYDPELDKQEAKGQNEELHCEDEDFNMDADYDPKQSRANLHDEIQKTLGKKRRNRKKKSQLAQLLTTEKPKFIPTAVDKTYSEYMDEYYKMDCEDIIGGDLPTRFKYREVVPNDYGLSVEEILLADDKELTQWVPLKKIVRHRPVAVEKSEVGTYLQRAQDTNLKRKVLPSLFKHLPQEPEIVVPVEEATKKKKKKKNKNKNKDREEQEIEETVDKAIDSTTQQNGGVENTTKTKKKKHKGIIQETDTETTLDTIDDEIEQNGDINDTIEPIKKKKKHKKLQEPNLDTSSEVIESSKKKRKDSSNIDSSSLNNPTTKAGYKNKIEKIEIQIKVIKNKDSNLVKQNKLETKREGKKHIKEQHQSNEHIQKKEKNIVSEVKTNNVELRSTASNSESRRKKKNRRKKEGFIVESVQNEGPSKTAFTKELNTSKGKKNLKRKLDSNKDQVVKKKKMSFEFKGKNPKARQKDKDKIQDLDNPLGKLSDERLKAYGLNPKKYRSFLKYKKF